MNIVNFYKFSEKNLTFFILPLYLRNEGAFFRISINFFNYMHWPKKQLVFAYGRKRQKFLFFSSFFNLASELNFESYSKLALVSLKKKEKIGGFNGFNDYFSLNSHGFFGIFHKSSESEEFLFSEAYLFK
jgi:hypothetical protein